MLFIKKKNYPISFELVINFEISDNIIVSYGFYKLRRAQSWCVLFNN